MKKIPVAAIVGPTASGKTALAVSLAERFDAEIVSADSMQIYKGMDIATAKPTPEEKRGVPHHMMDFLDPGKSYSVADFCEDAKKCIADIVSRGKRVIVCGGTGLYVDALLKGLDFSAVPDDPALRETLLRRKESEGINALYEELRGIDPDMASAVDPRNEKRVLRALEIWYAAGEKPSAVRARAKDAQSGFASVYIGLFFRDRQVLYDRIDRRVDAMMANGLADEARGFYALPASATAAQAIGYKELKPWLDGTLPYETAVDNLKRATRRYAKRQITWFGRNHDIFRLERDALTDAALADEACRILTETKLFTEDLCG